MLGDGITVQNILLLTFPWSFDTGYSVSAALLTQF
jgi:hypothetical protein